MKNNKKLRVLALVRSAESETEFKAAFKPLADVLLETRVADVVNGGAKISDFNGNDVLLVDVCCDGESEIKAAETYLSDVSAKIPVVASAKDATVDAVRHLLRLNVADFLPQPIEESDIRTALKLAIETDRRARPAGSVSGTVVSFVGSRGGVGSTTLAVHTACTLAGERGREGKVALIDMDLQSGNAGLYLDLEGGHGIREMIDSIDRLDGSLLRDAMMRHSCGLDVLVAPSFIPPLDALTPEITRKLLNVARDVYEYTIVDLPRSWTTWKHECLDVSDSVVLITEMTVAGIRESRRQLDTMMSEGLAELPVTVVVNRYRKRWGQAVQIKNAEQGLGRKIDHLIVNDYKTVSQALDRGVSLSEVDGDSKIGKQLKRYAADLVNGASGKESTPADAR